jgi:shikimate dehydrogenase
MIDCYGVFGNPIKHSLSPIIHTQFAKQTGLNIQYDKILAPIDDFAHSAKSFIDQGAKGFNITVPFKIEAFNLATKLSLNAKTAGAVNTIKVNGNELIGENTDGIGLVNDLTKNLSINLNNKTILILGAGGATRGILLPLLKQIPKRLMIANRTASRAEQLALDFSSHGKTCGFGLDKIKDTPVDVIINATSASLDGKMPTIANGVANGAICYDLMYGMQTPFMDWAKANNAKMIVDGLGMLVEQAAAAFEFWTGKKPNTQEVIKNLRG